MCSECLQTPCAARCPNAEPLRAVYVCAECGDGITKGDEYIEWDGKRYHAECVAGMTVYEIAKKLLDTQIRIA